MRYLKTVSRRFKNGFRCVSHACINHCKIGTDGIPRVLGRTRVRSSGPRRRRRHERLLRHYLHDQLYRTSWWFVFVSHRTPSVYVLPPVYCYPSTGTSCHPRKIHEICHASFSCISFRIPPPKQGVRACVSPESVPSAIKSFSNFYPSSDVLMVCDSHALSFRLVRNLPKRRRGVKKAGWVDMTRRSQCLQCFRSRYMYDVSPYGIHAVAVQRITDW